MAIARRSVEHLFMVMYFEERTMSKRTITQKGTVNPKPDSVPVNALKCKFLTDMELVGMGATSRKRYLYVVERLIKHYWRSPAELTEQQVYDYMLEHHRQDRVIKSPRPSDYASYDQTATRISADEAYRGPDCPAAHILVPVFHAALPSAVFYLLEFYLLLKFA